jgi:hypothetical protein
MTSVPTGADVDQNLARDIAQAKGANSSSARLS